MRCFKPMSCKSSAVPTVFNLPRLVAFPSALLLSGLLAAVASPVVALAQTAPPALSAARDPYGVFITEASRRFGIPATWIRAVMGVESGNNPLAVSPKGAMGLMQIMPSTWRELRVRYALGDNPIDPRANVHAGVAYLREMHERYRSITGMLAAYNAGPTRYDDYLSGDRALPAETRAYVNALAPLIGGEPLNETSANVASSAADWRDAPLFVVGGTVSSLTETAQADRAPNVTAVRREEQPHSMIDSSPGALFVPLSRAGAVR